MTQEEFEDKLARLVYRFVNNNEDEDLKDNHEWKYDDDYDW